MGYARHTNDDVLNQMTSGFIPSTLPMVLGQFREKEFGNVFEYGERRWPDDDFHPDLPHVIFLDNGETRLAHVLKTVAYVLTGEEKLERWMITGKRDYDTTWVRA